MNDPAALVVAEGPLSAWVIKTDRFGKAQGCWK